jgi:hypothetical protein
LTLSWARCLIVGVSGIFTASSEDSDWEWAKGQRSLFKTPKVGVFAGVGTFVVGMLVRGWLGEPNWFRASLIPGLIAVLAAVILPQIETLSIWRKRHAIRLEAAKKRIAELESAPAPMAAADLEGVRRRLGDLRLRYIELERAFLEQGGQQQLWHAQTQLHNEALKIIDRELGRDYWAQFKDVRLVPLVVPSGFPSDDAERLNLLYMIHGRSEWISKILDVSGPGASSRARSRPSRRPSSRNV